MSRDSYTGRREREERRTLLVGAVFALVIVAMIGIFVIRILTPDERLLVLRDGGAEVEEGDLVRITGLVRDFGFARGFDANTPGDTGGTNALEAATIEPTEDDAGPSDLSPVQVRDDSDREGDRVTVLGEVDEILGDDFFTLVAD